MIRVLIVCPIRLYREGLQKTLEQNSGLKVVGTARDGTSAVSEAHARSPDIVLLDVGTPSLPETLRGLVASSPGCKVVALGVREPTDDVIACAEAGVAGFVFRDDPLDELVETLKSATCGRLRCSQDVAAALLRRVSDLAESSKAPGERVLFTRRELEISGLLRNGLSNKQIANHLHIEVATVKNHVHSILGKLQVHSPTEAATKLQGIGLSPIQKLYFNC